MNNHTTTQDIVARLTAILNRYAITQGNIAAQVGMAEGTLSRILKGHQEPQELTRRALILWLEENTERYPVDAEA